MKTLGQIFTSKARTNLLRFLHYQPEPVGVRCASRGADVALRSAQLALLGLVKEGLVLRKYRGQRPVFELNSNHSAVEMIACVFEAATEARICQHSRSLDSTAQRILPFIEQATDLLATARKSMTS